MEDKEAEKQVFIPVFVRADSLGFQTVATQLPLTGHEVVDLCWKNLLLSRLSGKNNCTSGCSHSKN